MRFIYALGLAAVLAVQAATYFFMLLFRSDIEWWIAGAATLIFYALVVFERQVFSIRTIIFSCAIALFMSFHLIIGIFTAGRTDGLPLLTALIWSVIYFVVSNALCLAAVSLLIKAKARPSDRPIQS